MSDSQAYEEVTVGSDGVTVTKRFEEDEFPVPAIAFEFESSRDEEVTVRLTDTVPDDIEVEDLGFHPEYGSEYWTIDDDTITFERELGANASYTTVYGIRATGSDDIEQFLVEPTLESVEPPLPDDESHEDVIPESSDDVVKDAIAGDGEIPGLEDEDEEDGATEEGDDVTLDLKDPNNPESQQTDDTAQAESEESGDEDAEADSEPAEDGTEPAGDVTVEGDSLISAMATEIRQNSVSADDVKLLRQAFEIAAEEGGSTAAKIEQIQSDIADLRAYTSSLEEFLDENGTAQEMLEEFEQQVQQFDSQLADLEEEMEGYSEELSSIDSEVDEMSEQVESVSNEVGSIGDDVSELDEEISSVNREVNGLGNEVDDIGSQMGDLESAVDEVESSLSDVEGRVGQVEEEVTDGDIAEQIERIEEDIEDLQVWQEQIKETFGG